MGIDKQSGDIQDSFNQTGGVDTRLVFFKDWIVDGHLAGTQSPGRLSERKQRCGRVIAILISIL